MSLLEIILAIILPPLAVALRYGVFSSQFLINLLLSLLGYIPGIIHAIYIMSKDSSVGQTQ